VKRAVRQSAAEQLVAALEGHQDLRLTRLACGKLEKRCPPECARMSEPLPGPPGSSPHRTRDGCPQGCFADPLRGCYAELEAVRQRQVVHSP